MLNRKYADLRHDPRLDAQVLRYDPRLRPQSLLRLGARCRRKTKAGLTLASPGYTWALFFFPEVWWALTSVHDGAGKFVAHHVDVALPAEERDGMLSFLDLKLDLLILPDGQARWVDHDHYAAEIAGGTIPPPWQAEVERTVAAIDRALAAGAFPPEPVRTYRPPGAEPLPAGAPF